MLAIDNDNFISEVIDSTLPVLVDCWATWCGPCQRLAPELEAVASENSGRLRVVQLDVDQNQGIAQLLGVSTLPTMVLFVDGVVEGSFVGFRTKDAIVAHFDPLLPRKKTSA